MSPPTELDELPRRDDLARLVRTLALSAADERRNRFVDGLDEVMKELGLEPGDGKVGSIDVIKTLQRAEPPVVEGRKVLARLLARGVALEPPGDAEEAETIAAGLCWLAAHSYLDALTELDEALGGEARERMLHALAERVRDTDRRGGAKGRAEALAAAVALAASPAPAAANHRAALAGELADPLLRAAVAVARPAPEPEASALASLSAPSLRGEMVPAPLGPVALVMWSASGLIVLRWLWWFVSQVLLRCQRPAELKVDGDGVTLHYALSVLGRRVREAEAHIPRNNLARAVREVRYPRLALYAGLLSLALGTYLGVSFLVDGARAGSPSLLALGAVIFGLGVLLDLLFASLLPSAQNSHRVILEPRRGRRLALAVEDEAHARRVLEALAR